MFEVIIHFKDDSVYGCYTDDFKIDRFSDEVCLKSQKEIYTLSLVQSISVNSKEVYKFEDEGEDNV